MIFINKIKNMLNIDRIIKENINSYVNNIIKESEFDYVSNQSDPINELINYIKSVGKINLGINNDEFMFKTNSYEWVLNYSIESNAVADDYSGSYDVEPSREYKYEDEWYFDEFELYCYTIDGDEVPFTVTDEIVSAFKSITNVNYDGYDYPDSSIYR